MRVSHVENRIDAQTSHMEFIASAIDNLMSVGSPNVSKHRIETRKQALKEAWSKFNLNHEAIMLAMKQLRSHERHRLMERSYFKKNMFRTTHEGYLEALETMSSLLERIQQTETRSPSAQSGSLVSGLPSMFGYGPRLPYLNLPFFDGSPSEWLQFKDLFDSMVVSNTTLSPVWKLHYLKQSLKGTAAHLLKNTTLTTDNFQKAWDALISFYENKRLLVNSTLRSFINIKRITKESASELESLYTTITQIYRTLETLERPVHTWDDMMIFLVVERLDTDSVKAWEHHLGSSKDPPTWKQFTDFLMTRLLTLQAVEKSRRPNIPSKQQAVKAHHTSGESDSSGKCILCASEHYIASCPTYTNKTVQQRQEIISKNNLCYNCLGLHRVSACRSSRRCSKCGKKHHSSIHRVNQSNKKESSNTDSSKTESTQADSTVQANCAAIHAASSAPNVLLATVQVIVYSDKNEQVKARALIDPGSQISFISERLTQRLHLPREKTSLLLHGIGATKAGRTRGSVSIKLKPHFESSKECTIIAHVIPRLTSNNTSVSVSNTNWPHLKNLQLADPDFQSNGHIDIIIGADYYGQIIEEGLRRGTINTPTAQATIFGWVLFGPSKSGPSAPKAQSYHVSIDEELYELLQRFWKLDEMPISSTSSLSAEQQQCEDHFKATHSRNSTGHYIVRLPLRKSADLLGDSKNTALRMLSRLSKKLQTDLPLQKAYSDFLTEYETLHHMKMVSASSLEPSHAFYLPHHGVLRPNSITTKLRVVFNASSKSSTGVSLNDILHTGAKLQTELVDVLIRFRQFHYVFTSDIEKMYRQIQVHPDDWDLQRILWMNQQGEILTYQLTTVTYGLACAPFLALRAVQQLIEDEGSRFPLAISTLSKGRYVDDVFGGADTIEIAQKTAQQLNDLCMAGGFPLKKWISNNPAVLQVIPPEKQLFSTTVTIDQDSNVHTLGMNWNPISDSFHFSWTIPALQRITKRTTLSTIARFFDPLGLVAPIIINAKIFIQSLWSLNLGWDDPLPAQLSNEWINYIQQLSDLHLLTFPRWIGLTSQRSIEIHGFCDASQHALAAAVYMRSTDAAEEVKTVLICSKTKVAPLKRLTIPRLELSAAVLLTKLVHHVIEVWDNKNVPIHLWTDSAITHTWISNHPSRWKEFIHNRVCFIQESIPTAKWHFIPGKENPADCATRGLTPSQLAQHSLWKIGPDWLQQPVSSWPNKIEVPSIDENLEERPVQVTTVTVKPSETYWDLIYRYSSLTRLLRITATCKRVILRLQKKAESLFKTPITTQELEEAKHYWVLVTQLNSFNKEYNLLGKGESLPNGHRLTRLTPFMDSQRLLRLGGRLQASLLPLNAKHPFILPKESPLTQLVISDAHQRTLHGGTQDTLSFIRNDFWIIGGRVPVSSVIWKCIKCARYRQKQAQQLMGQLPPQRVTPSRPFLHSGVDYAGPLLLKTWKGRAARTYKAYIALFVCLSTSAIHLELVTDYTTDAFIAAYKRFTARRGICATLRSDCGTNLKGADSQLRDLFSSASNELGVLATLLANDGTQWLFNPPAAPHFGGKWEAGVKSVKYHLKRVIGDHSLTFEEMTTLLTQIEAVLNSRPLSQLTEDPNDLDALTPGHFLMGGPPTVVPEPSLENIKESRLSRWQLLRQMLENFWTRWSKECLQRYQTIYKWNLPTTSLQKGSLALVMDERYPPAKWPLGRILEIHPGKDGHTRVVTIRTQSSTFKRPITKISLLPIETNTL